ncbi:MAG: amidohydrolase family protein [Rhodospirillales bacterium]|nr:amidohydrolase family protein [Rhodospirillales bacterium]MDE2200471.1 amidohydrolase family protein [Rhodospirillales bacterium]MDE2574943.1 amidohydrolase family protein [Rhodospirillales bacterium]
MGERMGQDATLVIRGGSIADGSGGPLVEADIAIAGARIAAIGKIPRGTCQEIDARGKLVTPGFVDVHTHYDAQVTWGSHITPSSWNGVTTVLIGNCGVGFAPCRPDRRDMLVRLMEGVEDIPEVVLTEGLPWNWQSFPEFLDALAARRYDLDVATQVPHAALRVHVMGERGANHEPATTEDRAEMARLAAEGIGAGALGFSTSRTLVHKTRDGRHTPTLRADESELAAIANALGRGWLQVISDFDDLDGEFAMLRRLAAGSGRAMTISLLQREHQPQAWRRTLAHLAEARAAGLAMTGQVMGRPVGIMLGFEISQNPFLGRPSWHEVAHLPHSARMAILRDPAFRARLLGEETADATLRHRLTTWDKIFPLDDPPDYEPPPEASIAARAARAGVPAAALAYDMLLEREGRTILYRPLINYADGTLDAVGEMMRDPNTILGLGDGGAHVSIICDASSPTSTITHWTRDRSRGPRFDLPWVIRRLSADNAAALGLHDRGRIAPGLKADINVIDYARLAVHAPEVRYDLPAGGRRLVQRTEGYEATIVSGVPVHLHGTPTGALPGRLVRGGR